MTAIEEHMDQPSRGATSAAERPRLALIVLCLAQLMLIVDVVILNVALPSIRQGLHISDGQLQLASVAYTVTFGSLLIVAGRAGDLFGRRRLFVIGLGVFTAASMLTGLAQAPWQLFVGRSLQGIGAAMVSPAALSLLTAAHHEGPQRNRALAMWAAVGSGGAVAGQVLGGVITDVLGWRWIFFLNVPIGIVAIASASRLPESRERRPGGLDLAGAALLAGSIAIGSLGLARVSEHGLEVAGPAFGGVAVATLACFLRRQGRHPAPLVDLRLLHVPGVVVGNGVLATLAGGTAGALFFITLYLQDQLGYSPMAVGFAFAPVTLIVLAVSPLAGRLVSLVGVRLPLLAGTGLTAAGLLVLTRIESQGSYVADVLPGLMLVAIGNGLAFAPTMITATSGVREEEQGVVSGLMSTAQELGTALGLAALASIAVAASQHDGGLSTAGYRLGLLAATVVVAAGMLIAGRAPRRLGQAERLGDGGGGNVTPSIRRLRMSDPTVPGVPRDEGTTLTEVLAAYTDAGFAGSFTVTEDSRLACNACQRIAAPAEVRMTSMRRLEGASDPDDMLAIVAITCPNCGVQGTTTLGFGPAAAAQDSDVLRGLRDQRGAEGLPAHSAPGETVGDRSRS